MMPKRVLLSGLALLLTCAAGAAVVEEVVVKVNDSIVTKSEYDQRLRSTVEGMRREYKGPDLDQRLSEVPQRLLEQMEEELLLLEKAKQLYQVDVIVDHQIEAFMEENKIPTREELAKALETEGITMAEFRRQVTMIYVPEFMKSREIRSGITLSTEEIRDYYETHQAELSTRPKVRLQEILILRQDHTPEQASALADQIRKEFMGGADFADLARNYSQALSRGSGGDAGWFQEEELNRAIAQAAFTSPVGEVTDLIPTEAGWYLFRVAERKQPEVPSLEQARELIVGRLREEKFQKAYSQYIEEIKTQNYIRVNPRYL